LQRRSARTSPRYIAPRSVGTPANSRNVAFGNEVETVSIRADPGSLIRTRALTCSPSIAFADIPIPIAWART
jgi:hypothetical protein